MLRARMALRAAVFQSVTTSAAANKVFSQSVAATKEKMEGRYLIGSRPGVAAAWSLESAKKPGDLKTFTEQLAPMRRFIWILPEFCTPKRGLSPRPNGGVIQDKRLRN